MVCPLHIHTHRKYSCEMTLVSLMCGTGAANRAKRTTPLKRRRELTGNDAGDTGVTKRAKPTKDAAAISPQQKENRSPGQTSASAEEHEEDDGDGDVKTTLSPSEQAARVLHLSCTQEELVGRDRGMDEYRSFPSSQHSLITPNYYDLNDIKQKVTMG